MVARMREAVGPERVLIGELYLPIERLVRFYGAGLDLPANFHLLSTPWEAEAVGALIEGYEAALPDGAWPNWVLGNHDRPRLASRLGPAQALVAAVLLLTLRGTPTLYYGDELGLRDVAVPPEHVQDPWEKRVPGQGLGRDPVRAPMPWTLEAQRRLLPAGGRAVAAAGPGRGPARGRGGAARAPALPAPAGAAPRRAGARAGRLARLRRRTACWPTCAATRSSSRST